MQEALDAGASFTERVAQHHEEVGISPSSILIGRRQKRGRSSAGGG